MNNDTAYADPEMTTEDLTNSGHTKAEFKMYFTIYIGIGIGVGIVVCVLILVLLLRYSRRRLRNRSWSRTSGRNLILRGFSTVSQRGVVDSTAEFEMINNSSSHSTSSYDNNDTKHMISKTTNAVPKKSEPVPKKPERRRTRTSSSNVKYENVTLDPKTGFVVRKSLSMQSGIPFIDSPRKLPAGEDDEDDDVFE